MFLVTFHCKHAGKNSLNLTQKQISACRFCNYGGSCVHVFFLTAGMPRLK